MTKPIAETETEGRDYVNSFARGLDVIRSFTRLKPSMTLSEVAERTDMNRAAARRFLLTLVQENYAETDGKFFWLKPKVLELGFSVIASMDISETLQPVLDDLALKIEESCFAVILDDDSVVYIARALPRRMVNVGINIGSRAPAHVMSSGRVLLAGLPEDELDRHLETIKLKRFTPTTITSKVKLRSAIDDVRQQGWAMIDQEYELGLRSVSVPIRDRSGKVVAAINATCPTPRISMEDMRGRILTELLEGARRVSLNSSS